jgi:putative cell wall-binding protein
MKTATSTGNSKTATGRRVNRAIAALAVTLMGITGAVVTAGPAQAVADVLWGTITDAQTGLGVENVTVEIYDAVHSSAESTLTDNTGNYSFASVSFGGDYTIHIRTHTVAGNFAEIYYPGTPFFSQATTTYLNDGANVNKDFVLSRSGSISGNVTFTGPTHQIYVNAYRYNSAATSWEDVGNGTSDGSTPWTISGLLPGYYKIYYTDVDGSPSYASMFYPGVIRQSDAELINVVAGSTRSNVNAQFTADSPSNVVRLAGQDRFKTSARIAQEYSSADVVFVANGLGYPDALSAGPAAALLGGPLLLVQQNSIPAEIREQIVRLQPTTIYVVGGTGVVSTAVVNALLPLATSVVRISGANRYETSQNVVETIWTTSAQLFLADGRNFPDALSAAAASQSVATGHTPVMLVNGGLSAAPANFTDTFTALGTERVNLVGGTGVLTEGIATSIQAMPGVGPTPRYFGANRYLTSVSVNQGFFSSANSVYLAVGTGYADALAGAALAGLEQVPLYLVPGNCIPQDVLDAIDTLGATRIVLLGGTGVLSPAVEALTSCTPTTY